ncbi:MAG: two-component system sensor histidine kinase NtrB [Acidobacteriota bacterium]
MNPAGYAFLALTGLVAMVVGMVTFAVLRFVAAARDQRTRRGHGGAPALMASALGDAIARLKAQERATAARATHLEQLSSQIVTSLTSGLIVVDDLGRVQIVNPAGRRILHGDDGTVSDDRILDRADGLRKVIDESTRTHDPILRRTVTLDRESGPRHLGVTVCPLSSDGDRTGTICLFTDLTAVLALEDQLRLKEALARLGELTAGLAHEFRNGLATIHGYARLLDPSALPDPQRPYIEGIRAETRALGEVVTNFLNFARPVPLVLSPLDLGGLVRRAAADVPDAQVEITGDCGHVEADDVLLRQAVSNLFRNSLEACADAGTPARVHVHGHLDPASDLVTLTVRDNGPGIRPEALAHLFQPFFTMRPGGTGLGLAIVQKVIVSHNGRVTAANYSSGGAIFTITLPRARREMASEL